jgi:hypothetical protein
MILVKKVIKFFLLNIYRNNINLPMQLLNQYYRHNTKQFDDDLCNFLFIRHIYLDISGIFYSQVLRSCPEKQPGF